jgi:hypothetical protein
VALLLGILLQTEPDAAPELVGPGPTPEAPVEAPDLPTPTREPGLDVRPIEPGEPTELRFDEAPGRWTDERAVALELTVRHASGGPAGGVGLVLARGGRVLSSARTDETGRARLDGVDGEADLWVGGVLPLPHREILAECSGPVEIVLPDGAFVEGRVTIDGRVPEFPVPLSLSTLSRDRSGGSESMTPWTADEAQPEVPWPVRSALRVLVPGLGASRLDNAQLTGPGGSFRFSGLPPGWGAMFQVAGAYRWELEADANGGPYVVAPASGVQLSLTRVAQVTGRVVAPGGEQPVPGALVRWTLASDAASTIENLTADEQGRFAIPLIKVPVTRLDLRLRDEEWSASLEISETAIDATYGADLGDLELVPVRRVSFRVTDASARPVEGAVAVADDTSGAKSRPTDQDGEAELRGLGASTHSMVVWAHRYLPTEVLLPEDLDRRVDVVLARAASLDVLVLLPDGEPARNVQVRVSTEQALFERPDKMISGGISVMPEATAFEVGTTRPNSASFRSDTTSNTIVVGSMNFSPDRDGQVTLSALRAGVPFELSVLDASGSVVWGPEELRIEPGETREVRAVLPFASVDLAVRVRDGDGRPVMGADVSVTAREARSGETERTGSDGIAHFPDLYAGRVEVAVEKAGFADSVLPDTGLPPAGVPLDVILLPGLDLTVRLRDASGRSVAADKVWAVIGGRVVSRDETPAVGNALPAGDLFGSLWTLHGLPAQPVTLRVRLAHRVVEQEHDARVPVVTVVVAGG